MADRHPSRNRQTRIAACDRQAQLRADVLEAVCSVEVKPDGGVPECDDQVEVAVIVEATPGVRLLAERGERGSLHRRKDRHPGEPLGYRREPQERQERHRCSLQGLPIFGDATQQCLVHWIVTYIVEIPVVSHPIRTYRAFFDRSLQIRQCLIDSTHGRIVTCDIVERD